jgi:Methyltransferase domain
MDNSFLAKGTSLVSALVRSPSLVGPYVRYLPLWGRQPIACELPWVSFGALKFLNRYVRPHHEVFEYGGGGSTLYFARRAKSVLTMESHADWHRSLVAAIAAKGLANAVCELHPISSDEPDTFRQDTFFHRVRAQTWDIILIDCYCGYSRTRYGLIRPYAFELALEQLKPGGIIVLDDSWMFPELLGPRPGWRVTDYAGPGPCRYGITSTAILEKL